MDSLEQEAFEVLSLVRSLKNSFAPINRIPPEVFTLIPNHYDAHRSDRDLIRSTHVCRSWREILISRSSLWARLDCMNVDKTRTFIQRSESSPLDILLISCWYKTYLDDALSLVIPHVPRLRSLDISYGTDTVPNSSFLSHFRRHAPLLEDLQISLHHSHPLILDPGLFGDDLSTLRELCLREVITQLPWENMANLRVFDLRCPLGCEVTVTQLLDFFESAPLLRTIDIEDSIPESSDAPPERTVSLCHLKSLYINADPVHSILRHLNIPVGASLTVWTGLSDEESPLLDYFVETTPNIKNLSHITAVNLRFCHEYKGVQLTGPSASFCFHAPWGDQATPSSIMDHRILRSISQRIFSTTHRLIISEYSHTNPANVDECPVFQALSSTNNLRTLTLIECKNQPFISALDPEKNASKSVLCPKLEEIILYAGSWYFIKTLISMAKGRASRGAKLSSIMLMGLGSSAPGKGVSELRDHVMCVGYMDSDIEVPEWDYLSDESESGVGI